MERDRALEAEQEGESIVIQTMKKAEADKLAAEVRDAKAKQEAALKDAQARKNHAKAKGIRRRNRIPNSINFTPFLCPTFF
ncbi:MAG: hypothetical protein AAF849_21280 [Bacteroidota bacterium]